MSTERGSRRPRSPPPRRRIQPGPRKRRPTFPASGCGSAAPGATRCTARPNGLRRTRPTARTSQKPARRHAPAPAQAPPLLCADLRAPSPAQAPALPRLRAPSS
eukprot:6465375-Prymnesium_polylepis.2